MNTYGKRLESALDAQNSKIKDRAWLAGKIGCTVQALSQVIIGKTKALTAENHERAVAALNCNGYWLATGEGDMAAKRPWVFTLFNESEFMAIPEKDRIEIENSIAGQIVRLKQMPRAA